MVTTQSACACDSIHTTSSSKAKSQKMGEIACAIISGPERHNGI
jgi:hypothetical protein